MSYWVIARVTETDSAALLGGAGIPNGMVTARATAGARMTDGGGLRRLR